MPHGDFDFRIAGADETDLRRWRRQGESGGSSSSWWKWAWPPGIVIPVLAVFWVAPTLEFEPPPSVEIGGQRVDGERVLLIQDDSGSMGSYQAVVDRRIAALRAAGAYSDVACKLGNLEFIDFVPCAIAQARKPDVDGLYVFADFKWAQYDVAGVNELRRALESTNIRLYLDTMGDEPQTELADLARDTGGAIIHTPK